MTAILYEHALEQSQAGVSINEWLFQLDDEYDGASLDCLEKTVRVLLQREDLSPRQVASLAKLLLGLKRLPLVTPGLDVHLTLSSEGTEESRWWDVHLCEERFTVEWTGWVSGPFGSDSISGDPFEAEPGTTSWSSLYEQEWVSELPGIAEWADVEIEDESEDGKLDWQHEDGRVFVGVWMDDENDENDEDDEDDEWNSGSSDAPAELASLIDLNRARKEHVFANPQDRCDLCSARLSASLYYIDGAVLGGWANMCPACYLRFGQGIDWGHGQLFMRQGDGSWLMVAGFRPDDPDKQTA